MAASMIIASNEDVLDSISRRVTSGDECLREYSNYHIVSVENNEDALDELENLPNVFGVTITELVLFTNFAKTRAYAYIKTRSAMSPRSIQVKFEDLSFHKVRVRIRRYGVKKTSIRDALRGGFMFGELPFPLRPFYKEVELNDRKFHLEKDVEYVQKRQPAFLEEVLRSARTIPVKRFSKK